MIGSKKVSNYWVNLSIKLMFNLLCLILPNSINSFLHIDCVFWGNVGSYDWIIQTRRGHISKRKFREMNQHFCLVCWSVFAETQQQTWGGVWGWGLHILFPRFAVLSSLGLWWYERSSIYHMSMALFLYWYLLDTTYWPGWAQEKL